VELFWSPIAVVASLFFHQNRMRLGWLREAFFSFVCVFNPFHWSPDVPSQPSLALPPPLTALGFPERFVSLCSLLFLFSPLIRRLFRRGSRRIQLFENGSSTTFSGFPHGHPIVCSRHRGSSSSMYEHLSSFRHLLGLIFLDDSGPQRLEESLTSPYLPKGLVFTGLLSLDSIFRLLIGGSRRIDLFVGLRFWSPFLSV